MDSFDEYNLKKMNDVPCSIEKEVKVIPPANAEGYTTTSNQAPVVSYLNATVIYACLMILLRSSKKLLIRYD